MILNKKIQTGLWVLMFSAFVFAPANAATLKIIDKIVNWGHDTPKTARQIDTIIIHSSYNFQSKDNFDVNKLIKIYKRYNTSPHYLIASDGAIYRLVKDQDIAYHAGKSKMPDGRTSVNNFSIGIELINTESQGPNEAQYLSLANLVNFLKSQYNIKYVLGHSQIAQERKTDPWNFDWGKLARESNRQNRLALLKILASLQPDRIFNLKKF